MLSVHKIVGGASAASHYLDQVAQGREDYYAGEGEEAGRWIGAGATLLEWSGEVDGDDFVSLLAGAGLRKPRVNGVAGFDLTFRAPKSVSVLWAIASEHVGRELRAGHNAAVAEALSYLEREACRGRRGKEVCSRCAAKGSWARRSCTARRAPAIRCCTRTSSSATSPAARMDVGRRWMAVISTGSRRRPGVCIKRCCGAS